MYNNLQIISQTGGGDISSELLKAEKEAKELRAQNSTLDQKVRHQHEEIKRLNKVSRDTCSSSLQHHIEVKAFGVFVPCNHGGYYSCFDMFVQALQEALQTTQPLDVSSETLQDVWKHQVSFVHHHICAFLCMLFW